MAKLVSVYCTIVMVRIDAGISYPLPDSSHMLPYILLKPLQLGSSSCASYGDLSGSPHANLFAYARQGE